MCASLSPKYWTTFDDAQAKTRGSCPIHENEYPHPKKCSTPAAGTPLNRATPKAENTSGSTGCIYPANLVSIAPRVSEIWITQYLPIDLNVKIQPPAPGAPKRRSSPNYLVPVPGVCSTLSQNFTPIAPSCIEISSTVQTNKQTKQQT